MEVGFNFRHSTTFTIRDTQDRLSGIQWDFLSKTFQEAIIITHKLELRYIWIDSLCIIQNDTLDWEIESKQMGSIYGHSRVTIAALKSEDGSGGCFDSIDKVYPHPAGNTFMASRRQPDHSMWGHYQAVNTRLPLFSRAWTLQEELLAPRVLYFGPEELVFQCRSAQACHCGKCPYEWDTAKQMYESAFLKSSSLEEARNSWASIVQQYSSRSLTKETDRFPAISGLAKTFEGRGLGKYIAGLWTHDLPIWLTWRRQYHGSRGAAGANSLYVAPSWSWASMAAGTQVYFNWDALKGYKPSDSNVHLLEAVCDPVGVDHTGALRSGYLHFILILRAGERPGEYRRCGIGIIEKGVKLTEDFEQSTKLRAGSGLRYNVRKCNAFEAWFKDKEEEDIILL
ncbi:HET-domain-containing protein [Stipitochalara longipes BDJ]|nr:HET-domain-containing protein [Stipitochalara longipes BDJ]